MSSDEPDVVFVSAIGWGWLRLMCFLAAPLFGCGAGWVGSGCVGGAGDAYLILL